MPLLKLPYDILFSTNEHLNKKDLLALRLVSIRYVDAQVRSFCAFLASNPEGCQHVLDFEIKNTEKQTERRLRTAAIIHETRQLPPKLRPTPPLAPLPLSEDVASKLEKMIMQMDKLQRASFHGCDDLVRLRARIILALNRCPNLTTVEFMDNSQASHIPIYELLKTTEAKLAAIRIDKMYHVVPRESIDTSDLTPILSRFTPSLKELAIHNSCIKYEPDKGHVWPALQALEMELCLIHFPHVHEMFPNIKKLSFVMNIDTNEVDAPFMKWKELSFMRTGTFGVGGPHWEDLVGCKISHLHINQQIHKGNAREVSYLIAAVNPPFLEMRGLDQHAPLNLVQTMGRTAENLVALGLHVIVRGESYNDDPPAMDDHVTDFLFSITRDLRRLRPLQCLQLEIDTEQHTGTKLFFGFETETQDSIATMFFREHGNLKLLSLRSETMSWPWRTYRRLHINIDDGKQLRGCVAARELSGRPLDFEQFRALYNDVGLEAFLSAQMSVEKRYMSRQSFTKFLDTEDESESDIARFVVDGEGPRYVS